MLVPQNPRPVTQGPLPPPRHLCAVWLRRQKPCAGQAGWSLKSSPFVPGFRRNASSWLPNTNYFHWVWRFDQSRFNLKAFGGLDATELLLKNRHVLIFNDVGRKFLARSLLSNGLGFWWMWHGIQVESRTLPVKYCTSEMARRIFWAPARLAPRRHLIIDACCFDVDGGLWY